MSASLVVLALTVSQVDGFLYHLHSYIWGIFFIVWLYTLFNVVESVRTESTFPCVRWFDTTIVGYLLPVARCPSLCGCQRRHVQASGHLRVNQNLTTHDAANHRTDYLLVGCGATATAKVLGARSDRSRDRVGVCAVGTPSGLPFLYF
jgi:hypothetical protein